MKFDFKTENTFALIKLKVCVCVCVCVVCVCVCVCVCSCFTSCCHTDLIDAYHSSQKTSNIFYIIRRNVTKSKAAPNKTDSFYDLSEGKYCICIYATDPSPVMKLQGSTIKIRLRHLLLENARSSAIKRGSITLITNQF